MHSSISSLVSLPDSAYKTAQIRANGILLFIKIDSYKFRKKTTFVSVNVYIQKSILSKLYFFLHYCVSYSFEVGIVVGDLKSALYLQPFCFMTLLLWFEGGIYMSHLQNYE